MGQLMDQLKQALKSLDSKDKAQLRYAHDYAISQYLKLPDGYFIGVHCEGNRNLIIVESNNDWYFGRLNYPNDNGNGNVNTNKS